MRQRIVINLDGPGTEGTRLVRKRRRWPRVLALVVLLVLVVGGALVAVGGFFWWQRYKSTANGGVFALVYAAQRNDEPALENLINDDEVAKNMAASISQKASARYGYALNSSIQQRIDVAVPSLLPQLKQTIHDEVVRELRIFAALPEPKGFITLIVLLPKFVTIETEGDTAKVQARMLDRPSGLTMRRDAELWKVIEVKDDVLLQRIVDNVMKELPAIGSVDANSPLLKKSQRKRSRRNR